MLRHREKVLAHAEQQLRSQGKLNSDDLLQLYKKFLKIENHRIWIKHRSGGGGRDVCAERAHLVDIIVSHLLEAAIEGLAPSKSAPPRLALVATGGYGRGELNPFSDIDVMFLHKDTGKAEARVNEVVQKILYLLWDVGFKVGHSTRTVAGAIKHANSDMLSKTSMLEARLVVGDKELFASFRAAFLSDCVEGHAAEYIGERVANQAERHAKFGHTAYMQEPNIKNGCGGLRDYQNLLWISFFKERAASTGDLVKKGFLNEAERRQLDRAYDFELRLRTELHYFNKRATDVVLLNQQLQLSNKLGYPQKNILRRTEAFMRDYYQHARSIYHTTELISERLSLASLSTKDRRFLGFLRKAKVPVQEHFDGFFSTDGRLYPDSANIFTPDPARMMRAFQHLQQRQLRLSPELAQLIRRRLHLVDRTFQYSKAAREIFMAICARKGEVGRILRAMHEVDFLGRYIPEFGQLTALVQHEFFHRYTADEHTLVCIEKLDRVIDVQETKLADYRVIFQKLEDPFVLYLALLLHDTGKASNASQHAEASTLYAQKVARRLQLTPERRKSLLLLVDHHIMLSSTAQRRNLDDATTTAEFAGLVRGQSNLDALMLLTLADGQGTGDENWSDWKEGLVWQLYRNTTSYLADGEAFYRQRTVEREALRAGVNRKLGGNFQDEIDAHFESMPERYFQAYTIAEIAEHIRLFRRFLEAQADLASHPLEPAVKWISHPNRAHSEFWFVGWDRSELVARIAASLSVGHLNILSADVFTRADGLVLDVFRVCNTKFEAVTDEREMSTVEKRLKQSLETETFDFTPLLAKAMKRRGFHLSQELDFPTRLTIDNEAHPVYTLVDIQTPDRLGLLYHLLRAIGQTGVSIALSRIATQKGAAIDTFYVSELDGRKLRNDTMTRLQKALQTAAENTAPL